MAGFAAAFRVVANPDFTHEVDADGVQRIVTDMRVLEESVLESSVVAADIRKEQAAIH